MEMMYLVLSLSSGMSYPLAVIPEKYPAKQCLEIASHVTFRAYCVPAPKPTICRSVSDGPIGRIVCE